MSRLFGTDGVRGRAGVDFTTDLVGDLARASAVVLADGAARPHAVVGRDTRPSGPVLERAVADALSAYGVDVQLAGIIPTPAVAHLVASTGAAFGVVISASHNPALDNGIKFFGADGHKLTDAVEDEIEAALGSQPRGHDQPGTVHDIHDAAVADYVAHLVASTPHRADGLRVVVDCANGAAVSVAEAAYSGIGCDVVAVNVQTDGAAINDGCGATHLEFVANAVHEHSADVGIAHDGDADRCLAVDADGAVVDGDAILAILAVAAKDRGRLARDTVVTTVMTNLGFHRAMDAHGISVVETAVGDRHVLERMLADGYALGGEQSGHLVLLEHATTGDGLLTGLHLLARVTSAKQPLAGLAGVMTRLPQLLVNVPVEDREHALASSALRDAIASAERDLAGSGRVLVRASGTESLIRVMVEAPTEDAARTLAENVAATLR